MQCRRRHLFVSTLRICTQATRFSLGYWFLVIGFHPDIMKILNLYLYEASSHLDNRGVDTRIRFGKGQHVMSRRKSFFHLVYFDHLERDSLGITARQDVQNP